MSVFRFALTPGEPAGIGPDLCVALAQSAHDHQLVAIADPELLRSRAAQLGLPLTLKQVDLQQPATPAQIGELFYLPVPLQQPVVAGELDVANAHYVLETLRVAGEGCIRQTFDALITAPVHKGIINDAGIPFSGHTEFFQALTHTDQVVMMLATQGLRVALATTHLPLREVADHITAERLTRVLKVLLHDLRHHFGITTPHVVVAGLNPHAGEGGHLGDEEIRIIEPVLSAFRAEGERLTGPLPADTLFAHLDTLQADAVLAMYHDQGLPVLKYKGFGEAVNITLGLPIIRTSVDHGTALELAGTGKAQVGSLRTALEHAVIMAHARQHKS